jgi:outer membrane murein-binding lipoprotein Lpp
MSKQITLAVLILLMSIFSGCQSQPQDTTEIEQVKQQLAKIESRLAELTQNADTRDLAAQIATLEQKVNTLEAAQGGMQGQLFQVTLATYLLNTADFHEMDERLNQEGVIDPGDAGVVNRVNQVLAITSWPENLQAQVDSLRAMLDKYAEALSSDDVEAAKPLAAQAHELQHDFSRAVENWLAGESGAAELGEEEEHDHAEEQGD